MNRQDQRRTDERCQTIDRVLSRRVVVTSSGLAVMGLMSRSAFGQEETKEPIRGGSGGKAPKEIQERMEQSRLFSERMRNAKSPEEQMKLFEERAAQDRQRVIEALKGQLGVSDKEWAVIKPRVEKVYNLVHPLPPTRGPNERARTEVEQRGSELRELLRNDAAAVDQIKVKLAALRAAKGKEAQELATARQSLRQIVTVRQEATLVLNSLLD